MTERFAAHAPGISGAARRTLRTNLRFLARCVVPHLDPADAPLPRERAKKPCTRAEIDGYLALAGAQPTAARRPRATALVCLGAGAGLIRSDLRQARGTDVVRRHGGENGPHQLTYRQAGHTSRLIKNTLDKQQPDGTPSAGLQRMCDQLLEASIPTEFKNASSSLAVDWTDAGAWARPVPQARAGSGADPEARWGHRNVNLKIQKGEMFFGYYLSAATMVNDENGPAVPELTRRITVCSSAHDPAAALAKALQDMAAAGIRVGDILADSGFSHRQAPTWANPLRGPGATLVQDLHPSDRGPQGTHRGAVICNGNLYCPRTPAVLLQLVPLPPGASNAEAAGHDQQTAELARFKLGLHAASDADGYRRHACPATAGKIRCPLRPESMKLDRSRPEIPAPPRHPPACCTRQTITAGPEIAKKTRQKHDYPSRAWRISYARRTAAERLNASIKDTAVNSIDRGWIRLTGITPLLLWLSCLMVVRNQRTVHAFQARQHDDTRRAASQQQPRARRRTSPAAPAGVPP